MPDREIGRIKKIKSWRAKKGDTILIKHNKTYGSILSRHRNDSGIIYSVRFKDKGNGVVTFHTYSRKDFYVIRDKKDIEIASKVMVIDAL